MSLRAFAVSLPLLWRSATALPAGPGFYPNSSVTSTSGQIHTASVYGLIDSYDSSNWLSKFDVQDISDPTHGFVDYVNAQDAQKLGLLKMQNGQVYMGVDTSSSMNPNGAGRKSVRVQSKATYNQALVIADIAHAPGSACGWMVGANWPNQGELDIIEGVNLNTYNQITLHTAPGCAPNIGPGGETGTRTGSADCGAGGGFNGCGIASNSPVSYGTAFNANGGGVYASLWTNSGIRVWYFATRDVPANIRSGNPDPSSWGTPTANYGNGGCDFGKRFQNMNIVFDITFCGDWAGAVWGSTSCAAINPSCNAYVASQPQSFQDTYWLVNSIKVYST
ncbi:hypothetical protein ACEQ8H_002603 [Pleosporales sp. CAS-2024a]